MTAAPKYDKIYSKRQINLSFTIIGVIYLNKLRNFYEIFVGSFCDSNGDGIGDLGGVISKLDYIKDLGCDGIWLTPIMPSPSYHKYSVSDYLSIDPQFGTPDDFKHLSEECHKRGILLVIDFVMNHTSREHPWFLSAADSLSRPPCGAKPSEPCRAENLCPVHNPYVKYYNFSREKLSERYYPLNSADSPLTEAADSVRNKSDDMLYYMSSFSRTMPDVDLDNGNVRREFEKVARFWLENGADGFRMDAAKEYFSGDHEKNTAVLRWFAEYCRSVKPNCYIVAEVWEEFSDYIKYLNSGINSVFGFAMAQRDGAIAKAVNSGSPLPFIKAMLRSEKALAQFPNSADAPFICNHDTDRGADLVGGEPDKIKAAAGLLLTMSGTPYIYYGEEIGMPGSGADENKRLPMLWNKTALESPNPPRGAVTPPNLPKSVEEQAADPNSILSYYKRALKLRRDNPVIALGTSKVLPLSENSKSRAAIRRTYENSSITIVYNLGKTSAEFTQTELDLNSAKLAAFLTTRYGDNVTFSNGVLTLPPYGIALLE